MQTLKEILISCADDIFRNLWGGKIALRRMKERRTAFGSTIPAALSPFTKPKNCVENGVLSRSGKLVDSTRIRAIQIKLANDRTLSPKGIPLFRLELTLIWTPPEGMQVAEVAA
jgi:hypothetical protein